MDLHHVHRLQEEQRKAIYETDAKIDQIEQFKVDYKTLQDRLKTLPDKMTHEIMVPFGKRAFMPGRMVHTNEILVLLGDNWFVERSAKQAAEIAERRIEELDKKLKDLQSQRKLLEPRLDFTSDMQAELEGHGDVKEIVEEYDEEKEKLWDEQHRKNVRRYKNRLKQNVEVQQEPRQERTASKQDSALWSRLDGLERIEAERGELDSEISEEEEEDGDENHSERKAATSHAHRRVSWADEKQYKGDEREEEGDSDDDEDEGEEEEEDDDDEGADRSTPVRKTITFTHSDTPAILPHQVSASGGSSIQSPADIYKLFYPKPILKKTLDSGNVADTSSGSVSKPMSSQHKPNSVMFSSVENAATLASDKTVHDQDESRALSPEAPTSSGQKAFSGFVVEKPVSTSRNVSASAFEPLSTSDVRTSSAPDAVMSGKTSSSSVSDEPPRRVSKFKAARMRQNPS